MLSPVAMSYTLASAVVLREASTLTVAIAASHPMPVINYEGWTCRVEVRVRHAVRTDQRDQISILSPLGVNAEKKSKLKTSSSALTALARDRLPGCPRGCPPRSLSLALLLPSFKLVLVVV